MKSDTVATKLESEVELSRIVSAPVTYPAGTTLAINARPFALLLLVNSGVLQLSVPTGHWTVQQPHAIWIPAFTFHQLKTDFELNLHAICLPKQSCRADFPMEPQLLCVSTLLRELIHRLAAASDEYDADGYFGKIAHLIPEELDWAPVNNTRLPSLQDPRLQCIQQALLSDPSDRRTLEEWADFTHTSCRTLARLFQKEANICFCDWRNQLRLSIAIPMLARGESVTSVAFSVGFESSGTFTTMFRQFMGMSPSQYASRTRGSSLR